MSKPQLCRYCKQPPEAHFINFRGGIPVVGVALRAGQEEAAWPLYADDERVRERARNLRTLARGLRWRVARIERERLNVSAYLRTWADEAERRADKAEVSADQLWRS